MKTIYLRRIKKKFSWIIDANEDIWIIRKKGRKYEEEKFSIEFLANELREDFLKRRERYDTETIVRHLKTLVAVDSDVDGFEAVSKEKEKKFLFKYLKYFLLSRVSTYTMLDARDHIKVKKAFFISKRTPVIVKKKATNLQDIIIKKEDQEKIYVPKLLKKDEKENN